MILNLGCGLNIIEDAINVDDIEYPQWAALKKKGIEFVVANLEFIWPFKDNVADMIVAKDLFEHLPNQIHSMMESYRVLKPGGVLHVWVPTTDSRAAFADPTHVSFWNVNTFYYFVHRKEMAALDMIYASHIPNKFILLAAKAYTYRDMADSRGIYVQMQKPVPNTNMDEASTKESSEQ